MFLLIFTRRVLATLRSRDALIWTWIFPILLATLFYAAFSNLDTVDILTEIPVGVVDDAAYRQEGSLQTVMESVSSENGEKLFAMATFADADAANASLEKGEIDGYIFMDDRPVLVVSNDGLNQTILKNFLDRYAQTVSSLTKIVSENPSAAAQVPALMETASFTEAISLSQNPPTEKVNYFYALLAMVCMYGGLQGLTTVTSLQANLSPLGARRSIAPMNRFRMLAYDLAGGIAVHFFCVLVVVLYIVFVLGVNFGGKLGMVLLVCWVGSVFGIAFGTLISVTSKLRETAKISILISVTMVCCFFSGLMVSGINYTVAVKAPVLAWLNPAARIADAFYCLYYYDTYERFFLNIAVILLMTVVIFAVTAVLIRRERYESI